MRRRGRTRSTFAAVYLSSKLGQVSGRGLFHAIRDFYPRWLLYTALTGDLIGNTGQSNEEVEAKIADGKKTVAARMARARRRRSFRRRLHWTTTVILASTTVLLVVAWML